MTNKLFVGGLPYETTQTELEQLFASCGKVLSVKLIMDRDSGRSKGFGFVEMSNEEEAKAAMTKLNGSSLGQRKIFVNEARPQERRPGGFGPKPGFGGRPPGGGGQRPGGGGRPDAKGGFGGEKQWTDSPGGDGKRGGRGRKWGGKSGGGGKSWGDKGGGRKRGGKRRDFGDE